MLAREIYSEKGAYLIEANTLYFSICLPQIWQITNNVLDVGILTLWNHWSSFGVERNLGISNTELRIFPLMRRQEKHITTSWNCFKYFHVVGFFSFSCSNVVNCQYIYVPVEYMLYWIFMISNIFSFYQHFPSQNRFFIWLMQNLKYKVLYIWLIIFHKLKS